MQKLKPIRLALAFSLAGTASTGLSIGALQEIFANHYGLEEGHPVNDCGTCHEPVQHIVNETTMLNNYGYDLYNANFDFAAIENENSDNDDDLFVDPETGATTSIGSSNLFEITISKSNPGSQAEPDGRFIFETGMGAVDFPHNRHITMLGNFNSCKTCHNGTMERLFDDTKNRSIDNAFHKSVIVDNNIVVKSPCIGCHQYEMPKRNDDGTYPNQGCLQCHNRQIL